MVISQILGGLGNQMFQYAAGRALSLATQQPLLLDLRSFAGYSLHNGFELERVFSAPISPAEAQAVAGVLGRWRAWDLSRKLLKRVPCAWLHGPHLAIEPHYHYWPGLLESQKPRYLMGYWQSEKYFRSFEKTIRADFSFRTPLTGLNLEVAEGMQACRSVSLHIRRGDYVTHAPTAKMLNVCSLDYYRNAIAYIAEKVESPHFFLFSDDIAWVKANLDLPFEKTYVEHNRGADSYRDMQLMHLCRHHVIANSSFSWWGAWLNPRQDKIVVAPEAWFCDGRTDGDLIPDAWVRL